MKYVVIFEDEFGEYMAIGFDTEQEARTYMDKKIVEGYDDSDFIAVAKIVPKEDN